jgi:hypothetical protein
MASCTTTRGYAHERPTVATQPNRFLEPTQRLGDRSDRDLAEWDRGEGAQHVVGVDAGQSVGRDVLRDRWVPGHREQFDGDAEHHTSRQQHDDGGRQGQPSSRNVRRTCSPPRAAAAREPGSAGRSTCPRPCRPLRCHHHAPDATADRLFGDGRAEHGHAGSDGRVEDHEAEHGLQVPGPLTASMEVLGRVVAAMEEFLDAIGWPAPDGPAKDGA